MPYFGQTLSDINWNLKLIAEKLAESYPWGPQTR